MIKGYRLWVIGALFLCMAGCKDATGEYSDYACYVLIRNDIHLNHVLNTAMNPAAPGIFCEIRSTVKGGAEAYVLKTSDGQSDRFNLDGTESRVTHRVGRNNGIIVGYGTFDATFYAYDRECPNCYGKSGKSFPLTMKTNGHATCTTCGREYDMTNRGLIVTGDDGEPLTRYHASTTGPNGVMVVN